jgi:hypothetical protein
MVAWFIFVTLDRVLSDSIRFALLKERLCSIRERDDFDLSLSANFIRYGEQRYFQVTQH